MDLRIHRKVEIERLRETKFDGSRAGKNFTVDRQVEPLVMPSEIAGLEDRHAYLKLGNNVARFVFDFLDSPGETEEFVARKSEDDELAFDRRTLTPLRPWFSNRGHRNSSVRSRAIVSGDGKSSAEKGTCNHDCRCVRDANRRGARRRHRPLPNALPQSLKIASPRTSSSPRKCHPDNTRSAITRSGWN